MAKAASPTGFPPTATTSGSPTNTRYSPTSTARSSTLKPSTRSPRGLPGTPLRHPAQLLRLGTLRRELQHPAPGPGHLPGQEHLRPLRHHRQRHTLGALWTGHLTIEISNTTPLPAKVYSGEGIAQLLFLESDEACETATRIAREISGPGGDRPAARFLRSIMFLGFCAAVLLAAGPVSSADLDDHHAPAESLPKPRLGTKNRRL